MADSGAEPKAQTEPGVSSFPTADDEAPHDGDNKFQKAISAWRSKYSRLMEEEESNSTRY